jgi:DNA-directed RNA polymerase specialized sigma24 family protein
MTTMSTVGGTLVGDGFAGFYTETFGDLAGYGWHLTGDPHVGDELAQEALTRVCARWGLLREPRPYAYRVVTNLARDRWRSTGRERAALAALTVPSDVPAPDTATLDAVRRLPEHLRDVVLLHYYADLPVEEVARALHRPTGTVKRRLSDARTALAVSLEDAR